MRSSNAKLIVIAQAASGGCNHHLTPRSANFNRKPPTARFPLPALAARSRRIFLTVRFPASVSRRPLSDVPSPAARKPARRKAARKIRMQNSRAKLYAKQPRMQNPARGICLKKTRRKQKNFRQTRKTRLSKGWRLANWRPASCLSAGCLPVRWRPASCPPMSCQSVECRLANWRSAGYLSAGRRPASSCPLATGLRTACLRFF